MQAVKSLGYLLLQGDSLVFQINGSTGLPGQVIIATGDGGAFWGDPTGATEANNGVSMSGDTVQLGGTPLTKNTEVDTDGKTLRFRDAAGYPDLFMNGTYGLFGSDANTYLDIGSVAGRARIVASTTAQLTSAANTDVSATDTVTIVGQRIRLSAADTRIQQVSKNNALNRVMMIDSTTEQVYYRDVSSIAGGGGGGSGTVTSITAGIGLNGGTITTSGTIDADTSGMLVTKSFLTNQGYTTNTGTVTGTGTTGTIPVWSGSSALGDSPLTVSSGSVIAGGTGFFQPPVGTTAQRPGTPTAGMIRYNTTLGNYDFYGASAWKNFVESATGNGLGTSTNIAYFDANGRITGSTNFRWNESGRTLGINTTTTSGANIIVKNTQDAGRVGFILTQGFAADTVNWTAGTGWTFNGTQAVATAATGDLTYTAAATITIGKAYELTYTIASYSAGQLTINIGNASYALPTHNATNNTVLLLPTSATGGIRFTTATFTGNLDNVTIVEVNPAPIVFAGQSASSATLYMPLTIPNSTTFAQGGGGQFSPGANNNFIGSNAGKSNTYGTGNNFFGLNAGLNNTGGNDNNFFGIKARAKN